MEKRSAELTISISKSLELDNTSGNIKDVLNAEFQRLLDKQEHKLSLKV